MDRPQNKELIVKIHQVLFEMARGNFNSRIPLSSYDDELETLVVLINMVAEEMKEAIFYEGFVNTHSTHQFISQTTFILDAHLCIQSFTQDVTNFLGYEDAELIHKPISSIITAISLEHIEKAVGDNISSVTNIVLDFKGKEQLLYSVSCSIGKLVNRSELLLNLIAPVRKETYNPIVYKDENEKHIKTRRLDALLIQKLYDYILAHLEEPLPPLKAISRDFGTNELN
jgi:hypothetical protein